MAEGHVLAEGTVEEIKNNEEVIEAYLGHRPQEQAGEGERLHEHSDRRTHDRRLWRRRHSALTAPSASSAARLPLWSAQRRWQIHRHEGRFRHA
jgi:hypothetical protein